MFSILFPKLMKLVPIKVTKTFFTGQNKLKSQQERHYDNIWNLTKVKSYLGGFIINSDFIIAPYYLQKRINLRSCSAHIETIKLIFNGN